MEECNCAIATYQTRHVSTIEIPAAVGVTQSTCLVDAVEVSLPVLTNTKALAAGDELIVHWRSRAKPTQTSKTRTWQDAATQEFRRATKAARA